MSHPDLQRKRQRVNDDRANSAPPKLEMSNIKLPWWNNAIKHLNDFDKQNRISKIAVSNALRNIRNNINIDYTRFNFRIQQLEQICKMHYENLQLYTKSDGMRINALAEENKQLKDTLKNLENTLTIKYKDIHETLLNGFNRDYNAMVKEKDKEIEELKKQLNMKE